MFYTTDNLVVCFLVVICLLIFFNVVNIDMFIRNFNKDMYK